MLIRSWGNLVDNPAGERARALAKTGQFTCLLELRRQLRLEGYAANELRSDKLRGHRAEPG